MFIGNEINKIYKEMETYDSQKTKMSILNYMKTFLHYKIQINLQLRYIVSPIHLTKSKTSEEKLCWQGFRESGILRCCWCH